MTHELIVQYRVKYVDYVNSTRSPLVLLRMRVYHIPVAHVAKSINVSWPRNSLLSLLAVSLQNFLT